MSSLIIWIDTKEAHLIQLGVEGRKSETLKFSSVRHPVESQGKNHPVNQTDEEHFYHQVCEYLKNTITKEWFITGPGMARDHFIKHIEKHHPQLKSKILGSEKSDRLTDAELLETGLAFFRKAHLYQNPQ